jgi:hypothetical protein
VLLGLSICEKKDNLAKDKGRLRGKERKLVVEECREAQIALFLPCYHLGGLSS